MPSKAETSQFFSKPSTKKNHIRSIPGSSLKLDGGDPFRDLVSQYYAKRVEEIRNGKFRPTPRPSFEAAVAHYSEFVRLRFPDNLAAFKGEGRDMNVAVIPFMYRCPHPTAAQADAWNDLWNDGGSLYEPLIKMMPKGQNVIVPYVLTTPKPSDAVFIAIVVAHFKLPEPKTTGPELNYVECVPE
jgi:hypothetical protein